MGSSWPITSVPILQSTTSFLYRAFYKYATGLSAAIALSQRVVNGGEAEQEDYLGFLKGGCSKYPLDLLRDAGVDMETPEPVDTALKRFEELVDELIRWIALGVSA